MGPEKIKSVILTASGVLPWATRITEYGKTSEVLGTKRRVDITVSPAEAAESTHAVLQGIMGALPKLHTMPSMLMATLGNMILHPCIMWAKWHDWDGKPIDSKPLFYQAVDDAGAAKLNGVSDEVC